MTKDIGISKLEAAQRQIDTAIDLWFEDRDGLSTFTLAFASLKVLFDIYPHRSADGFATDLDSLLGDLGWKSMSKTANFLKHAGAGIRPASGPSGRDGACRPCGRCQVKAVPGQASREAPGMKGRVGVRARSWPELWRGSGR